LPGRPQVRPSIPQRPGFGGNTNTIINRPITNVRPINNITTINNITQITNNITLGAWTSNYLNHWHNYTPRFYRWYYRPYPWYHGSWHWHWSSHPGVVPWYVYSSLALRYGYWTFVNPLWVAPAVQPVVYLNYSRPVTVVAPQLIEERDLGESTTLPERTVQEQAQAQLEATRTAFRDRNYREAQRLVEAALAAAPEEAVLHEFRSLVLFALGRYGEAAAALYALLAVHPGWNWTTLSSLYGNIGDYQQQLQALNAARQAQPDAANLQFLYAYHMLTIGKPDDAKTALLQARKSLPEDPLLNQMLLALGERPPPTQASPTPREAVDVELDLKGLWKSERSGGRAVYLNFDDQGQFQWDSLGGPEKDTFTGAFAVDGTVLTLERTDGGALVGQVIPQSEKSFLFRLIGTPPQDPGMRFERVDSKP
jgi:tetratricopeptide (TPR) repeat protein